MKTKLVFEEQMYITARGIEAFSAVRDPHVTDEMRRARLNSILTATWQRGHDLADPGWLVWGVVLGFGFLLGAVFRGLL
jgi:hypothetical protein